MPPGALESMQSTHGNAEYMYAWIISGEAGSSNNHNRYYDESKRAPDECVAGPYPYFSPIVTLKLYMAHSLSLPAYNMPLLKMT